MEMAEPQKEHEWLQKLVGEWTVTAPPPPDAGPDAPPVAWTEKVRSLHGLWVLGEGEGEMPGVGPVSTVLTLGYDPKKQRYVGTWFGSMMATLWVYEGELDATGTALTLSTEGPDTTDASRTARYREIIAFQDPDHRTFTSLVEAPDGTWQQVMEARYQRRS